MKPVKTRILKVTKNDGNSYYVPQYKKFLGMFWSDFDESISIDRRTLSDLTLWHWDASYQYKIKLPSLSSAQEIIDAYVSYVNNQNNNKIRNKVINVEVIKYP